MGVLLWGTLAGRFPIGFASGKTVVIGVQHLATLGYGDAVQRKGFELSQTSLGFGPCGCVLSGSSNSSFSARST